MNLAGLISRAKSKTTKEEAKAILERLDTDRKHILNPQCHHDTMNIYKQELKTAIADMEELQAILR